GHDAFIVEDADHLLKPRAEGNENLHRFLTIADGVVRAQGRKVIFSTNLPNLGDLDDALVRPGRCFPRIYVRNLTVAEAKAPAAARKSWPARRSRSRRRKIASARSRRSTAPCARPRSRPLPPTRT